MRYEYENLAKKKKKKKKGARDEYLFLILKVGNGKRKKKDTIFGLSKTFILQFHCEGVRFQRRLFIIFLII